MALGSNGRGLLGRRRPAPASGPLFADVECPAIGDATTAQRFHRWLRANPGIVERIVVLALKAQRAGLKRYGMKALFEVVRYEEMVDRGDHGFKMNNNYTAPMARWIMWKYPELNGFFETRER